jgi:hypothetical protein
MQKHLLPVEDNRPEKCGEVYRVGISYLSHVKASGRARNCLCRFNVSLL